MLFQVGLHDLLILCVFGAAWGGIWASFLGCMVWRIPRGIPLSRRSFCSSCKHKLSPLDLVPIFSWLLLGGKCRYCGAKVPAHYVISEIVFASMSVLCLLQYGITVVMLRNWIFLCCLFCIAMAEWDSGMYLDAPITIGLIVWIGTFPYVGLSIREALVTLLKCIFLFFVLDQLCKLLIDLLDFAPFKGFGYHTTCAALLSVAALYLRALPTLLALVLACVLLFLLRAGMNPAEETPLGSTAAMMAVSSAIILLLRI